MPYIFYDYSYIVFVFPALIISMIAQWKVQSTYKKYSQIYSKTGMTAADASSFLKILCLERH